MKIESKGLVNQLTAPRPEPVNEKVSFEEESLQSRYLGSIPSDYWSPWMGFGGYHHAPGGVGYGYPIHRNTPIYEPDGKPRVDVVDKQIKANAYSPVLFGALGAAGGAAVGAGIGALVGHFASISKALPMGVAGTLLAGAGGLALAHYAANDRVRLEWREFPIHEKELEGYWESVTPHYETRCTTVSDGNGKSHQECHQVQNGWNHTFSPDVRYWQVGSYVGPQVVHFQQGSGEWKPDAPAAPETAEKPKEGVDPTHPPQPNTPTPATEPPPQAKA